MEKNWGDTPSATLKLFEMTFDCFSYEYRYSRNFKPRYDFKDIHEYAQRSREREKHYDVTCLLAE